MPTFRASRDADGMYEIDELEDLLAEERGFDEKDSGSDNSEEEVLYQQPGHHLTYKQKKHLQSLPPNSLVRQIVKNLEQEGFPLPCYLFWPWPTIRTCFNGFLLLGFIAVAVAALVPIIQRFLSAGICVAEDSSEPWWLKGPLFKVDQDPVTSLATIKGNVKLLAMYGVKTVQLSSSDWWRNAQAAKVATLSGMTEISQLCHSNGMELVLSVFLSNLTQVFDENLIKTFPNHEPSVPQTLADIKDICELLIDKGIDGFYFEDTEEISSKQLEVLLESFKPIRNQSKGSVLFGMDYNPSFSSAAIGMMGDNLDLPETSSAAELNSWIRNHFTKPSRPPTLWKVSRRSEVENDFYVNARLLELLLPGIPMLDVTDLASLHLTNSDGLLEKLLHLRKTSLALQGSQFSLLNDHNHSERKNIFALLRTLEEERRYLILWNLSSSEVSLDFSALTMRGKWIFRKKPTKKPTQLKQEVKMRQVGLKAFEFGCIELP